ncbi:MAG: ABC transporter substrate-binding protein [Candidatus Saccharibacteria bacterium]
MPDSNFDDQNNLPQDNPNDNPVPTTPSTEGYVDSSQSEPQSEPTNNDSQFQPPQSTVSSQPPTVPAQKKSKKLLLSMVLIVVIVIIAGGAYMLTKNHNKTKTTGGKKDIALIKYGFDNDPLNSFYPADSSNSGPLPVQSQIFEGLVSFQHGTQIKPQIASSWSNPNDTTWIFNIKPHIYYHDGDTATAQDVVYTWQQINQNDPSYAAYLTNTIKDVKAINNSTVEITTTSPDPILLNRLASMFIIDSKAPKGTPAWGLGAGAYTVKPDTTPSENSLDLVAFNKWNGGHIYTKAVDYTSLRKPGK